MSRPELYTVDYFPHPVEQGKKMAFMKSKYGHKGYCAWYQILEELGKSENHFIDLRNETTMMLTAGQLMISEKELIEILTDLGKLNAINNFLWTSHRVVFSEKFNKTLEKVYERRKNKCMNLPDLCKHLRIKCIQKPHNCIPHVDINTQSKVKESKVKENTYVAESSAVKEEKNAIKDTLLDLFPYIELKTKTDYSNLNGVVKALHEKGATPDRIRKIYKTYVNEWPDIDCTPRGLLNNYDLLRKKYETGVPA